MPASDVAATEPVNAAPEVLSPALVTPPVETSPAAAQPASSVGPTAGLPAYFQPGILMQGWIVLERLGKTGTSTARLRRAEIYLKGKVIPDRVSYLIMFDVARVLEPQSSVIKVDNQDPAPSDPKKPESVKVKQSKGAVAALQDYYMQLTTDYADVYFGQFKIPVSYDGSQTPPYALLMPDRSTPTIYFDDRRDIGLKATKKFTYLRYTAAVFNGAGQNTLDNNNGKDVALRLDLYPFEGVGVGAVGYYTVAKLRHKAANDRYEADIHVEHAGVFVQAEYMQSHLAAYTVTPGATGYLDARGAYAMAAYTIAEDYQPVIRISYLDPDTKTNLKPKASTDLDEYWQYEVGFNYYVQKNTVKLQAAGSHIEYENKTSLNQIIVGAQIWY